MSATSEGLDFSFDSPEVRQDPYPLLHRLRNEDPVHFVAEIKTTFASRYTREVSLAEALSLDAIAIYGKQATGEKVLINPNQGV